MNILTFVVVAFLINNILLVSSITSLRNSISELERKLESLNEKEKDNNN